MIEEERGWSLKENNKNYKEEKNHLGVGGNSLESSGSPPPYLNTRFLHLTTIAREGEMPKAF